MTLKRTFGSGGTVGGTYNATTAAVDSIIGPGTLVGTTASPINDGLSFITDSSANLVALSFNTGLSDTSGAAQLYVMFPTLPGVASDLLSIRTNASGNACKFVVSATNKFQLQNSTASIKTFANTLVAGTIYRLELACLLGTGSTGTIYGDYYVGQSSTPAETGYAGTGTDNTGTGTAINEYRAGKMTAVTMNAQFGGFAINNGTTSYIGPLRQFGNTFEFSTNTSAFTPGTANTLTPGSSVSGSPTATYSTTGAAHGSLALRIAGTTGDIYKPYQDLGVDTAQIRERFYITFNGALPTGGVDINYLVTGSAGSFAAAAGLQVNGSGLLQFKDFAGAIPSGAQWTTAPTVGTKYRVEMYGKPGASTSTGTFEGYVYSLDSTTPLFSFTSTTMNLGTNPLRRASFGKLVSSGAGFDVSFDDILVDANGSHADLGPVGATQASTPPTASVGANVTIDLGSTFTITGAASDSGTISTIGFGAPNSYPAGGTTTAPTNTPANTGTSNATVSATGTPTVAGVYVYPLNVLDNSGTPPTVTPTVTVNVRTSPVGVQSVVNNPGGFTVVNAADAPTALNSSDSSKYVLSPANPSGASMRVRYAPLKVGTGYVITTAEACTAASPTITRTYRIYQGSTVIESWTVVLSTTKSNTVHALSTANAANITDTTVVDLDWSDTV